MVALNDNLPQGQEFGCRKQLLAEYFVSLCLGGETDALPVGRCSPVRRGKLLIAERAADACGNNIIFAGPGADFVLRQEPTSGNALGATTRWIQRDPIGYSGGINLYDYVGGRAVVELDPMGTFIWAGIPGPALFYASCDDAFGVSDKWGFVGCAWCPGDIDPVGAGCVASCCYTYNSGMACDFLGCFADCVEANGCNGCWIDVIL